LTQTVSSAVAERRKTIGTLIEQLKPQIARALPRHMDADRLARIALTVIRQQPQLAGASPESLLGALMTCAQLGLEPGPLGHAWLVPFRNSKTGTTEITFIPGYRGLIELARRSGQVSTVAARVVRDTDDFDYAYGLDQYLKHKPHPDATGKTTHVYAVVKYKDGSNDFEVMTRNEVEAVRARSKASKSGPWVTDWDEMAKKTAIRRLSKRMPMSVELAQALAQDERVRTEVDLSDLDVAPVDPEAIDGEVIGDGEQGSDWPATADVPGGED